MYDLHSQINAYIIYNISKIADSIEINIYLKK